MPVGQLLSNMISGSGLSQYPNPQTYNAAAKLEPQERPTVPVKIVDPRDYYDGEAVRNKSVNGFTTPAKDAVYVSKYSKMLNHPEQLGAVLAHEQQHIIGKPESDAYALQAALLKRFNKGKYKDDINQFELLAKMLKGK